MNESDFFLGQRVLYSNEICVTCEPPRGKERNCWAYIWIRKSNGVELHVSRSNVKPLPGGQL